MHSRSEWPGNQSSDRPCTRNIDHSSSVQEELFASGSAHGESRRVHGRFRSCSLARPIETHAAVRTARRPSLVRATPIGPRYNGASVNRCRMAHNANPLAIEGGRAAGFEQPLGSEADSHGPITEGRNGRPKRGRKTLAERQAERPGLLVKSVLSRLRALGGQPSLLRPRQESIEPLS
jgi:hypothetical protein